MIVYENIATRTQNLRLDFLKTKYYGFCQKIYNYWFLYDKNNNSDFKKIMVLFLRVAAETVSLAIRKVLLLKYFFLNRKSD